MTTMPLNEVQYLNYAILSTVRDAAREDPAAACCSFGLSQAQLHTIGALTPAALMSIVARMGNEALFVPREDFETLLTLPAPVSSVLMSAKARTSTGAPPSRR